MPLHAGTEQQLRGAQEDIRSPGITGSGCRTCAPFSIWAKKHLGMEANNMPQRRRGRPLLADPVERLVARVPRSLSTQLRIKCANERASISRMVARALESYLTRESNQA